MAAHDEAGWTRLVLGSAVLAATAVAGLATASRAAASPWYWTPGACKSQLHNYGVRIGDGRAFSVDRAYCVGMHNHCWSSNGVRRYKVFIAVTRSYDGVVRRFILTVTGRDSWSGSSLRIIERYMGTSEFDASYGPAAWSVAAAENSAGCWDAHP